MSPQLSESSSCTSLHSMDTSSSTASVSLTSASPSHSGPSCTHRRSVSLTAMTPGSPSQTPAYNTQAQDACIIRVSLEQGNGNLYKSILVNDKCISIPFFYIDKSCDKSRKSSLVINLIFIFIMFILRTVNQSRQDSSCNFQSHGKAQPRDWAWRGIWAGTSHLWWKR